MTHMGYTVTILYGSLSHIQTMRALHPPAGVPERHRS
jgi:hypothetical protein